MDQCWCIPGAGEGVGELWSLFEACGEQQSIAYKGTETVAKVTFGTRTWEFAGLLTPTSFCCILLFRRPRILGISSPFMKQWKVQLYCAPPPSFFKERAGLSFLTLPPPPPPFLAPLDLLLGSVLWYHITTPFKWLLWLRYSYSAPSLPLYGLQYRLRSKQRSSSDVSPGQVTRIHIPLVHRRLVECDNVIGRTDLKEVDSFFIKIRSFYIFLLCSSRLLKQRIKTLRAVTWFENLYLPFLPFDKKVWL